MREPLDTSVRWKMDAGRLPSREGGHQDTVEAILSSGMATEVVGLLSAGKEADVYLARWGDAPLAVKVYRLYRTSHRRRSGPKLDEMAARAAREHEGLHRAWKGGVPVPAPAGRVENLLFLRYLGGPEGPAPSLREADLEDPAGFLARTVQAVEALLRAGLVHGDLSAFNILVHEGSPWLIDFADWIRVDRLGMSPWKRLRLASERLRRDLAALDGYFRRYGLRVDGEALTVRWIARLDRHGVLG